MEGWGGGSGTEMKTRFPYSQGSGISAAWGPWGGRQLEMNLQKLSYVTLPKLSPTRLSGVTLSTTGINHFQLEKLGIHLEEV